MGSRPLLPRWLSSSECSTWRVHADGAVFARPCNGAQGSLGGSFAISTLRRQRWAQERAPRDAPPEAWYLAGFAVSRLCRRRRNGAFGSRGFGDIVRRLTSACSRRPSAACRALCNGGIVMNEMNSLWVLGHKIRLTDTDNSYGLIE